MNGRYIFGLRRRLLALCLLTGLAAVVCCGPAASAQALATDVGVPDVEVVREHMFLTRGPEGLRVLHILELVNVGAQPAARVPLPLPGDARWEQLPEPLEAAGGTVVDPTTLAVGEGRQYALAYSIPWREPMVLRRALLYPTEELWIWAETGTLAVRGVRLESVGQEAIEGIEFAVYRMRQLQPHENWQVVLDRPGGASAELPVLMRAGMRSDPVEILATHPMPRLALTALVLVAAAAGLTRMRARRGTAAPASGGKAAKGVQPGGAAPARPAHGAEAERLKDEIVRLDVAFHKGELDEDVYRKRRTQLKARLMQLTGDGGRG